MKCIALLCLLALTSVCRASTITVTVSGTVASGAVESDSQIPVFSVSAGASLAGRCFTAVIVYDDSQGANYFPYSTRSGNLGISGSGFSDPVTDSQLTIGPSGSGSCTGVAVDYGEGEGGSNTEVQMDTYYHQAQYNAYGQNSYQKVSFYLQAPSGGTGWPTVADWRGSYTDSTFDAAHTSGSFSVDQGSQSLGNYQAASGNLTISSITVAGIEGGVDVPIGETTAFYTWAPNSTINPGNGGDQTVAAWQQTLQDINSANNTNPSTFTGFYGATVEEFTSTDAPSVDSCWDNAIAEGFTTGTIPADRNDHAQGGAATISLYGHWYDSLGYTNFPYVYNGQNVAGNVSWYQQNLTDPAHFPCGFTVYQQMRYTPPSPQTGGPYTYGGTNTGYFNALKSTIINATSTKNVSSSRSGQATETHPNP